MKSWWQLLTTSFVGGILAALVVGIGLIVAREALLSLAVRDLRQQLRDLRGLAPGRSCDAISTLSVGGTNSEPQYRQLRFLNDRDYVLEVVCQSAPDEPLMSERRQLGLFITKAPGSAGVLDRADAPESYVGLVVFGDFLKVLPRPLKPWLSWISRSALVGLSQGEVVDKQFAQNGTATVRSTFASSPISSCEGYGFVCCDRFAQQGRGDAIEDLASCPGNCFASCVARPAVVSWRSNPLPDWQSSIVQLSGDGSVQFFYVIEDADEQGPWKATVEFGDGQQTVVAGKSGETEHSYHCAQSVCDYSASIVVENKAGIRSAATSIATIKVRIAPPAPTQTSPSMFWQ